MKPDKKRQSQQAFDQQAATYDTAIQGSHARTLYPYMLQEITCAWGDRVLDLGCGTGALTAQVLEQDPRRQVTGLDLSEQMLAQARARLGDRVKLIQGDSECLPFPDGSFDVVYCCDSFHHYPDPAAVLAEVGRVLVPGGVFLLGDIWLPLPGRLLMNPLPPLEPGGGRQNLLTAGDQDTDGAGIPPGYLAAGGKPGLRGRGVR